jgi:hypothetical protein
MAAPLLVLAGFAIVAALIAWSRWLSGRRWAAAGNLLLALAAALAVGTAWPVARHLETYEPVARGQAVAAVFFERSGPRRYRATLTRLPSGRMQVFELEGDEWRIAAREIGWTPRAAALGLKPVYRLESLGTRAATGAEAPAPSAFALSEPRGADLWARAAPGSTWSTVAVRSERGSSWRPMSDGARFEVRLEADALVVEARGGPAGQDRPDDA